jgi:hypothetical protein
MTKIVYNDSYGGFGLSVEAFRRARELSGDPRWGCDGEYDPLEKVSPSFVSNMQYVSDPEVPRSDPYLVAVVGEMGEAASGPYAKLRVIDLPPGTLYRIDEYDGKESVMAQSDYEWSVA